MQLSEARVLIIGLGLMGGSLALALRGKCRHIEGVTRNEALAQLAVSSGAVDTASCKLDSVSEADIVVLATPLRHILEVLPDVAGMMRAGGLLIDLGSAKAEVVCAMNKLPAGVLAVGGHPMCGKEVGGLRNASSELYQDTTFVLTPTERTTEDAMRRAKELVLALGAQPLVLDARQHDDAVAIISHLPYLMSSALVHTEMEAEAYDPAVEKVAASGFRDSTRLAASEVEMMLGTLLYNRQGVERALDMLERQLITARASLGDPAALESWLTSARRKRRGMYQ